MMKNKIKKISLLLIITIGIWIVSILSFNPVTDHRLIKNTNQILSKIESYESIQPIHDTKLTVFYNYISLSNKELLFIEQTGLNITRINKGYWATIATGFDSRLYYHSAEDCWYSTKLIIGVRRCDESLIYDPNI